MADKREKHLGVLISMDFFQPTRHEMSYMAEDTISEYSPYFSNAPLGDLYGHRG